MTPPDPNAVSPPDAAPEPDAVPRRDAVPEATRAAPERTDEAVRPRRRWPWLVLAVLILAAGLGAAVGVGVVIRGRSFGAPLAADAIARPTFVVAAPPSPSPSGSPRPAALPSATASGQYTVASGDTLRSIAEQLYGDPAQWPRIYDANRDTIGPDPDALSAGMRLRIPNS